MKIVTTQQAVLDLILKYWDNPSPAAYKGTLLKIREHWPIGMHSMSLDWYFELTPESLVNLSKKYLNKDFQVKTGWFRLEVDSDDFCMRIISWDDYEKDLPGKMHRIYLGV